MDNLFLVEHSSQVEDLLHRGMKDRGKWVALGPGAMWALRQRNISYCTPEDFYIPEELQEVCLENHERVEELCNRIDKIMQEHHQELVKWNMRPFLFAIFPLTMVFDGLVSRIFKLQAILKANSAHKIWVHIRPLKQHFPWGGFDFTFLDNDTLWGQILSLSGWNREFIFLKDPETNFNCSLFYKLFLRVKVMRSSLLRIAKNVKESFIFINTMFNIKLRGIKVLLYWIKRDRRNSLLIDSFLYDWKYTLGLLEEKGWRVILIDGQTFKLKERRKQKVKNLEELVKADLHLMSVFEFGGISFYSLLRERVAWLLENSTSLCGKIIGRMERIIKKYRVKGVLYAVSQTLVSHIVQQAAKNFGLSVICWQHGFMTHKNGRINQLNEFGGMMTTDAILTFGREATKAHSFYVNKYSSRIISVGSASIDKIKDVNLRNKESFEKTILYVTTSYYGNQWYCGFYPYFNDRLFFKAQLTIMEFLKQIVKTHQVKVTVKLHPATLSFDPPFVYDFLGVFTIVKKLPSLSDLFLKNHIIIIDSATTTSLQALATEKPVFVLMNHVNHSGFAREMFERRVVCRENIQELMHDVKSYFEQRIYPADVKNDEFLRAYGNHLNDGKSDQRAVDAALAVMSEINGSTLFNKERHIRVERCSTVIS